jgi:alpha-glucosidase (family GH31 glycosyl hydrolase)
MPLYVRSGAVIPLDPVRQYTSEPVEGPLTLVVFPGGNATSWLYDDDGISFEHRRGASMRMRMAWDDAGRTLRLSLAPGSRMFGPRPRRIEVRLAGDTRTRAVTFDGSATMVKL